MNKYILDPRKPYTIRIKMGTHKVVSVGFGILFSIEHALFACANLYSPAIAGRKLSTT